MIVWTIFRNYVKMQNAHTFIRHCFLPLVVSLVLLWLYDNTWAWKGLKCQLCWPCRILPHKSMPINHVLRKYLCTVTVESHNVFFTVNITMLASTRHLHQKNLTSNWIPYKTIKLHIFDQQFDFQGKLWQLKFTNVSFEQIWRWIIIIFLLV